MEYISSHLLFGRHAAADHRLAQLRQFPELDLVVFEGEAETQSVDDQCTLLGLERRQRSKVEATTVSVVNNATQVPNVWVVTGGGVYGSGCLKAGEGGVEGVLAGLGGRGVDAQQLHGLVQHMRRVADVDRRLLLVAREHPHLDPGLHAST